MSQSYAFYDDVSALEKEFGLPPGALRDIPIYARTQAVDAIMAVQEMERSSLFRPGIYYIVLADLIGNTNFNVKYGDKAGDTRIEWFQTCAIEALGKELPSNFAAYLKPIADAALLIFGSFRDVVGWSNRFTAAMNSMSDEYVQLCDPDEDDVDAKVEDFRLRSRRLVHLGEVRFREASDPICLSVSQTFHVEKTFREEDLGCTQPVLAAVRPLLPELGLIAFENAEVQLDGDAAPSMTYYLRSKNAEA